METVYAIHTPRPDGTVTITYFSNLAVARDIAAAWQRRGYAPRIEHVQIPAGDPCPNHGGHFDCTPFCPVCAGDQEITPNQ